MNLVQFFIDKGTDDWKQSFKMEQCNICKTVEKYSNLATCDKCGKKVCQECRKDGYNYGTWVLTSCKSCKFIQ